MAQQLDVFCWTVCWFLMVTVCGKKIESTSKRDRGLRFLLIPRLAGVFVELKNSRNYFKSHLTSLIFIIWVCMKVEHPPNPMMVIIFPINIS
jgi:hypothetical protein